VLPKIDGDDQDSLRWRSEVGNPKERRYVRVAGVSPDIDILPFTNDLDTLMRGVAERVFMVKSGDGFTRPPRPAPGHFSRQLEATRDLLRKHLPSTAPVSHQQFVDAYKGRKRMIYQNALDDIRAGRSRLEDDARLNIFVKFEKTDCTTKKDPVPRIISPRDPRFNVRLGRYLKPLEHRIFKSIAKLYGHPTVIKGFNAVDSARILREKWEMFRQPVVVGLDASRFDQHVSLDALRWEHGIYLDCFKQVKHRKRLRTLLKLQEVNRCRGEVPNGVVEYTIAGTRMSGDMNTSLGNCILMCAMIHSYAKCRGVDVQLANNGDDCVVFMEQRDLAKFMDDLPSWFLAMGFNMTIEDPVTEFDQLEFCQTRPVYDGIDWIMCRNPHTALVKDSVMLKPWDSVKFYRGWLDAVGTGGIALTGGLPVFQEFYAAYVRSGCKRAIPTDLLPWSFRQLKEGVNREYSTVSAEARASFYWAFGVTPDEQLCLEGYYRNLNLTTVPGPYAPRLIMA
jgi:hypothetical protein